MAALAADGAEQLRAVLGGGTLCVLAIGLELTLGRLTRGTALAALAAIAVAGAIRRTSGAIRVSQARLSLLLGGRVLGGVAEVVLVVAAEGNRIIVHRGGRIGLGVADVDRVVRRGLVRVVARVGGRGILRVVVERFLVALHECSLQTFGVQAALLERFAQLHDGHG